MSWVATAIVGSSVISAYGASRAGDAQERAAGNATAEQRRQFDLMRQDTAPYRQIGVNALNQLGSLYGFSQAAQPGELEALQARLGAMPERVQTGFESVRTGMDGNRADVFEQRPIFQDNTQARADLQAQIEALQAQPARTQTAPDYSAFFESPGYQFNLQQGQQAIDRSMAARGKGLSGQAVKAGVDYASGLASNEFGNYFNRLSSLAGIGQSATNTAVNAGQNAASNIGNSMISAGNARANTYQGINNAVQGGIQNYQLYNYLNPQQNFAQAGGFQFGPTNPAYGGRR